jgi:hypothetical protein
MLRFGSETAEKLNESVEALDRLRGDQSKAVDGLARLLHPLGDLRVRLYVVYPITQEDLASSWIQRLKGKNNGDLFSLSDPETWPKADSERLFFDILIEPVFTLTIWRGRPERSSAALVFKTRVPVRKGVVINLKRLDISQDLEVSTERTKDTTELNSWRDLAGAYLTVELPNTTGRLFGCELFFAPNGSKFGARRIHLDVTENDHSSDLRDHSGKTYVRELTPALLSSHSDLPTRWVVEHSRPNYN